MMFEPNISLIIGVYNEESTIGNLLSSIRATEYPKEKLEIIIIGKCSTDMTDKIIEYFISENPQLNIKFLQDTHKGIGNARNIGIETSSSDILTILDGDHMMTPDYLHKMVAPLEDSNIHGSDPIQLISNKENILARLLWNREYLGDTEYEPGFRMFRKKVIHLVGMYDNRLAAYDDQITGKANKLGFKSVKADAILYHAYPGNTRDILNAARWRGMSLAKVWIWDKQKAIRIGMFPALCISPLASVLLCIVNPFFIFGALPFIFMETVRIKKMYRNDKWKGLLLMPLLDIAEMTYYSFSFIRGLNYGKATK